MDLNNNFFRLKVYEDESHLIRALYKCKDCQQLYFYEFYEEIDWIEGKDPQYRTLIPVSSEDEADNMNKLTSIELLRFFPRIQSDWPSNAIAPEVKWVGK